MKPRYHLVENYRDYERRTVFSSHLLYHRVTAGLISSCCCRLLILMSFFSKVSIDFWVDLCEQIAFFVILSQLILLLFIGYETMTCLNHSGQGRKEGGYDKVIFCSKIIAVCCIVNCSHSTRKNLRAACSQQPRTQRSLGTWDFMKQRR